MASRQLHRLTAMQIGKLVEPGYYADGGGLYLQISVSGARSWIFMFTLFGRRREMGLGPLSMISLATARKEAAACREMVRDGSDPILARKNAVRRQHLDETPSVTFREAAETFIAAREAAWNNPKHRQQWRNTLKLYAHPVIGDVLVSDIDTTMIVQILQPIWRKKAETARRVRGRIKAILDAEMVLGHRADDNPARYVDHLDRVLPRSKKRQDVKHHPALPWEDMPAFFADLRTRPRRASRALRLLILTTTRTNEVRFARPEEFDLDNKVWTIPGDRMKAGVDLRVPLCDEAVELVKAEIERIGDSEWLFPGYKKGCPLSNMALLKVLKVMERTGITVHGFRSTFRDWVADCTEYPDSLAEQALAHTIKSMTVKAYRRRDMLERRRAMMEDWARYCAGQTGAVLPLMPAQSAA